MLASTGIACGMAVVAGIIIAKLDIHLLEKRMNMQAVKRWAELDANSDEEGGISWSKFMEIQRKYK